MCKAPNSLKSQNSLVECTSCGVVFKGGGFRGKFTLTKGDDAYLNQTHTATEWATITSGEAVGDTGIAIVQKELSKEIGRAYKTPISYRIVDALVGALVGAVVGLGVSIFATIVLVICIVFALIIFWILGPVGVLVLAIALAPLYIIFLIFEWLGITSWTQESILMLIYGGSALIGAIIGGLAGASGMESTVTSNYDKAVSKFKNVYEKLHEERYRVYSELREEISSNPECKSRIKDATFNPIKTFLCKEGYKWNPDMLRCSGCNYSLSELDNHILAVEKKREMILAGVIPPNEGGGEGAS